jgi:hypothetical protein
MTDIQVGVLARGSQPLVTVQLRSAIRSAARGITNHGRSVDPEGSGGEVAGGVCDAEPVAGTRPASVPHKKQIDKV